MLDTSAFISALSGPSKTTEVEPSLSAQLVEGAIERHGRIYISTLTAAELLRKSVADEAALLRSKSIELVAFDPLAAAVAGDRLPLTVVKAVRDCDALGRPLQYFKVDAMIVASAIAERVDCLVTVDDGMERLAKDAGLTVHRPSHFTGTESDPGPLFSGTWKNSD